MTSTAASATAGADVAGAGTGSGRHSVEVYYQPDAPNAVLPMHSPGLATHLSKVMANVAPVDFRHPSGGADRAVTVTAVDLVQIISAIADSCGHIAKGMQYHMVQKNASTNEFGDTVLSVDMLAENYIRSRLSKVPAVKSISSEEHPTLDVLREDGGVCCITYDPLDGSSVIDTNFTVGSIFAIWPGATPVGLKVRDILASVVCVFGPRCTLYVSHRAFGCFEYMLFDETTWGLVHREPARINPVAKYFAPGNLRAASVSPAYFRFVEQMIRSGVTLRYTGALVPDVTQILVKKSGVFVTPVSAKYTVKLRMCFEVAPIGFMVVCSGGDAFIAETCEPLMDADITALDQRSSIVVGSSTTVRKLISELRAERGRPGVVSKL